MDGIDSVIIALSSLFKRGVPNQNPDTELILRVRQ